MKKLNVCYFGTPDFSVPSLDLLNNHPLVNLKYVISMPDRPAGRGHQLKSPETIDFAKANKITYFQTENINKEHDFLKELENSEIHLFIVLAFAQFLNSKVLSIPTLGCFNIHTSILPKYRGAAPIQYALLNGDSSSGVSIQKMVKQMDAGDLVHFDEVNISNFENGGLLYTKLKFQAALSLEKFLIKVIEDKLEFSPQEGDISFAPTLKKEDGHIYFDKMSFDHIRNKLRAFDPWPGTYFYLNNKRVKIIEMENSSKKLLPGSIISENGQIFIGCLDKTIRLKKLQVQGKKETTDKEFLNGFREQLLLTKDS